MAIIVKMPAARSRPSPPAEVEAGATILFFTGVRYCRDEDDDDTDHDGVFESAAGASTDEDATVLVCL